MHTLTISLQGAANDSTSVELSDADALPAYVKLKEVLLAAKAPRKTSRKESPSATAGPSDTSGNGDLPRSLAADVEADR